MASKVSQINDPEHDVFQGLWKLKDSVKVRISTANGAELVEQMQETKKWVKTDVYLFDHEVPVVKYCLKGAKLSPDTCKTLQLDDVVYVKHISKSNKPNVLLISFLSYSLLLSFKSKFRMELWMSEIICQTDIFSFLLYESTDKSAKLGYYQLRFLLGKLVVYDAITKKATWNWKISQIQDYHNINSTSVKLTITDTRNFKDFYFTGKRKETFCERLQMVLGEVQKGRQRHNTVSSVGICGHAKSLETINYVQSTSPVLTAHPFSKCTTMLNINTKHGSSVSSQHYLSPSDAGRREFHSSEGLNYGSIKGAQINHRSVEHKSSMEIPCYSRDKTLCSLRTSRRHIRHSKSLNSLCNNETTSSLHKEYKSFNNLINSNEEDDYVVSTYFRVASTDSHGYLKLLPDWNDYEEIDDKLSVNKEPDYCIIGGIDAY